MTAARDVLVIDDEPVITRAVERVCQAEGLSVTVAASAAEAAAALERGGYRLIVCDVMMADVDGFAFLAMLARKGIRTPVILTTGMSTMENAVRALASGAIDFIPKPFSADELLAAVHRGLHYGRLQEATPVVRAPAQPTTLPYVPCPPQYHRLGYASWMSEEGRGTVLVGVSDLFLKTIEGVQGVTQAAADEEVHTIVDLIENGFDVISIDDNSRSTSYAVKGIEQITGKKIKNYLVDLKNFVDTLAVFQENPEITAVSHSAAYKAVGESVEQPLVYYENNMFSLINLLKCVKEFRVAHFVFASSCTVYGSPDETPVTEDSPIKKAERLTAPPSKWVKRSCVISQETVIPKPSCCVISILLILLGLLQTEPMKLRHLLPISCIQVLWLSGIACLRGKVSDDRLHDDNIVGVQGFNDIRFSQQKICSQGDQYRQHHRNDELHSRWEGIPPRPF